MIRVILNLIFLSTISLSVFSQCVSNVDFNTWVHEGPPGNGNWVVGGGGSTVNQSINGEPTFYVSPDTFINVIIQGTINVSGGDDDWIGFVFGYKEPIGNSTNYDCYLFDWKQSTQGAGQEGFALMKIQGNIPTVSNPTYFWDHTNDPTFQVLATDYGGGKGWVSNTTHLLKLIYTSNQIIIIVDNDTIFNLSGCYEPGRFGFYNYSQANVTYANFDYQIDASYNLITPQICVYDSGLFQFVDTSCSGIPSNIASWNWDFGDGSISTEVNPSHSYNTSGSYAVEMIITDNFGCSDSTTKNIIVQTSPISSFISNEVCLGNPTNFTDNSSLTGGGSILFWDWDFDNGNTSSLQNPSNLYTNDGIYNVMLIVTSDSGCIDTTTFPVTVHQIPIAGFSANDACLYDTVFFTNTSSIDSGTLSWIWDFGDGSSSATKDPSHYFLSDSIYTISLIVSSDNFCSDTSIQLLQIFPAPNANFYTPPVCYGNQSVFTDQSMVSNDLITNWYWDFGNGSTIDTNSNTTNNYLDSSIYIYNVTLTVITTSGCIDSISLPVFVNPLPEAKFTSDTVCLNQPTVFYNSSTLASGTISSYQWDLGDGFGTSTSQSPSYVYGSDGSYSVSLSVTSDSGCTDDTTFLVEVYSLPVADFNYISVCQGDTTFFTDGSTNDVILWAWDFDTGEASAIQNPYYIYKDSGLFNVELSVIDTNGCSNSTTILVKSYERPNAGFTIEPETTTLVAPFANFYYNSSGAISYDWNLGNGSSFTTIQDTNFTHIYSYEDTATYQVQQIAINIFGCRDTFTAEVSVREDFTIFIPSSFSPNNDGINDSFGPKGIGLLSNTKEYEFYIFNRWGDLVFETKNLLESWDGVANDKRIAPEGVYVWHIKLEVNGLRKHQYFGHVTLLK